MEEVTEPNGGFLIAASDVNLFYECFFSQVLKYNSRTKIERNSLNFGACKGETFDRVMIYPNGPLKSSILKGTSLSSPKNTMLG